MLLWLRCCQCVWVRSKTSYTRRPGDRASNYVGGNFCCQEEESPTSVVEEILGKGEEAGWLCVALAKLLSACMCQVEESLQNEAR